VNICKDVLGRAFSLGQTLPYAPASYAAEKRLLADKGQQHL